jgi:hypothetical protein
VRWVCRECGCLYTPGAPCCPDCRATAHDEEGAAPAAGQEDEVPKIDRFGAATIGPVTTVHASAILPDGAALPPVLPAAGVKPAAEEGEAPAVVTVADQKAAGVPPEETVTVAEQKAGTPPPVAAPSAPPAPKAATPPPSPAKPATPQQKATP